jgi:hypothetical protein
MNGRSGLRTEVVAERDKPVGTCLSANPPDRRTLFRSRWEWVRNVEVEGAHDALLSPEALAFAAGVSEARTLCLRDCYRDRGPCHCGEESRATSRGTAEAHEPVQLGRPPARHVNGVGVVTPVADSAEGGFSSTGRS